MQVVLSRPWDDKEIVDVYLVSHDSEKKSHASNGAFQIDWDEALTKVKKAEPETWMVNQVIDDLRAQGWQIIRLDTVDVSY